LYGHLHGPRCGEVRSGNRRRQLVGTDKGGRQSASIPQDQRAGDEARSVSRDRKALPAHTRGSGTHEGQYGGGGLDGKVRVVIGTGGGQPTRHQRHDQPLARIHPTTLLASHPAATQGRQKRFEINPGAEEVSENPVFDRLHAPLSPPRRRNLQRKSVARAPELGRTPTKPARF